MNNKAILLSTTQILDIIKRLKKDDTVEVKYICPEGLIETRTLTKENDLADLQQTHLRTLIENLFGKDEDEPQDAELKVCETLVIGSEIKGLDLAIEGMEKGFNNIKMEKNND